MELRARSRATAAPGDSQPPAPPSASSASATTQKSPAPVNLASLFCFLLASRLLNALVTRTFFQPDEHYQTTEIAHRVVFGYGFKSWEWSSSTTAPQDASYITAALQNLLNGPVRSILHPLLFVPGYALLKLTGLDRTYLLVLFPRLQQAVVSAIGDWYTFRLAQRIGGPVVAWFAALVGVNNLYALYTATRTFSNTTEAAVTAAALFYWPFVPFMSRRFDVGTFSTKEERDHLVQLQGPGCEWRQMAPREVQSQDDVDLDAKQVSRTVYDRALRKSVVLAAVACLLRPTNGVLWVYLAIEMLARQVRSLRQSTDVDQGQRKKDSADVQEGSLIPFLELVGEASSLVSTLATIGLTAMGIALVVDTAYDYTANQAPAGGRLLPALSLVSFVHKNIVANLSIFYGANPWHWYISQGVPVLCTLWLPATLFGLLNAFQPSRRQGLGADVKKSLARLVCVTVAVYSLLGHKEFRFLQPLLPALTILAATGLAESYSSRESRPPAAMLLHRQASPVKQLWRTLNLLPLWLRALLLTVQPIAAIYLTSIHSVAQEQVPYELGRLYRQQQLTPSSSADQAEFGPGIGRIHNLGFLMPCHSTPWATHLHDAQLVQRSSFIQCPPPPSTSSMSASQKATEYWDQSDFFYHDPIKYLVDRFPYNVDTDYPPSPEPRLEGEHHAWDKGWRHSWPSHLVVFESLLREGTRRPGHTRTLKNLLSLKGYREVARYWNTPKHEDARREGDVVVLAYKGPKSHR
ncbi:GPI mannosyltransferase 3 [Pseudozyma hubeiensis]|nr:GPI mannosyltransferase 3 [Pseudozyma hubeiensis]